VLQLGVTMRSPHTEKSGQPGEPPYPALPDRKSGNGLSVRAIAALQLECLELLDMDRCGFDQMDRAILCGITDKFNGGPVGVESLLQARAVACGPGRCAR
jgi:hypothetical protein